MDRAVILDTDVLVDFFRGHAGARKLIEGHGKNMLLPSVVVSELYAGVRGPRECSILDDFISLCSVVPLSHEIARHAGLLKSEYGKSHGVGLPDAVIAATAVFEQADLLTLNVKHYPMLKGLKPAYRKRS